ncbi:MAG: hypothetical protein ABSH01_24790 [Terriglobia bacterium]
MYTNRLRLFLALSIVIGAVPVYGKHQPKVQDCQIRFAVLMYDFDHPEQADQSRWGQLTDRQRNWWGKKGQQKFPSACMVDNASQAEYVIAWSLRAARHRGLKAVLEPTDVPVLRRGTSDCRVDANGRDDCTLQPSVETVYDVRRVATQEALDLASIRVLNARTHKTLRWYESASDYSDMDVFKKAIKFIAGGK